MTGHYTNSLKSLALPTTKVILNKGHSLYIKYENGRGNGRWLPIIELFFDPHNRVQVRYRTRDKSEGAQPYGYATIGTLLEKEDAV